LSKKEIDKVQNKLFQLDLIEGKVAIEDLLYSYE